MGGGLRRPDRALRRPLPFGPGADRRRPGRQDRSALPAELLERRDLRQAATATALAVDSQAHRLFADHEDEVRVFGALGQEIPAQAVSGLEDSQGVAFDPRRGALDLREGRGTDPDLPAAAKKRRQLATIEGRTCRRLPDSNPNDRRRPRRRRVYAVDTANDEVVAVTPQGKYSAARRRPVPGRLLRLRQDDNDIAVEKPAGPAWRRLRPLRQGRRQGLGLRPDRQVPLGTEAGIGRRIRLARGRPARATSGSPNRTATPTSTAGARRDGAPNGPAARSTPANEVGSLPFAGSGHLFVARDSTAR